jgi:hypothetical protein
VAEKRGAGVNKERRTATVHIGNHFWHSSLVCPRCDGDCLHHGRIEIFDRSEDAINTALTIVSGGLSANHLLPSKDLPNPSSRRHGLRINFWCEGCPDELALALTLAQHKGTTYLEWEYEVFIDEDGNAIDPSTMQTEDDVSPLAPFFN